MSLTAAEHAVLASLAPFPVRGVPEADLDDILDDWFANDHFDDNPVYTWNDNESLPR